MTLENLVSLVLLGFACALYLLTKKSVVTQNEAHKEDLEKLRKELAPPVFGLEVAEGLNGLIGGSPEQFKGAVALFRLLKMQYTAPQEAKKEFDRAMLAEKVAKARMERENARAGVVGTLLAALPPAGVVIPNVNDDTVVNVKPAADAPKS